MTIHDMIERLKQYPPHGEVQVFINDEGLPAYYDVGEVQPLVGGDDAIIELGEVRCVG